MNKFHLIFLSILILAAFLRFHQIDTLAPLIGDQGRDFLAARDFVLSGNPPLLGIPSSIPRFHQGPAYIWLVSLTFFLFGFNPQNPILFAAIFGLLAVGLSFVILRQYFGLTVATIAGLILATSPFTVIESRMAYHTNPIPLFSLFYLYSLFRLAQKPRQSLFWPFFLFALLFQFELVVAPLILLIPIVLYLSNQRPSKQAIPLALAGLILGLLPQIIHDLTNGFRQLGLFVVWIGYRITSFVGVFSEHQASSSSLHNVLTQVIHYLQKYFFWQSNLLTIPFLFFILIAIFQLTKKTSIQTKIIIFWFVLMISAFFVHGNTSTAYYPVLFVPLATMVGLGINSLPRKILLLSILFTLTTAFINTRFLLTNNYLVGPKQPSNPFHTFGAPLHEQLQITEFISSKTNNQYQLKAIGKGSAFASHLDNYRYLLWWTTSSTDSPEGIITFIKPIHEPQQPINVITYTFDTTKVSFQLLQ